MSPSLKTIPIRDIRPSPFQPRRDFDEDALRALAESIEANGLIQPIKVVPAPAGGYHLLDDGERRLRAMRDVLGWKQLEIGKHVLVMEPNGYGDADRLARALAANEQRAALNPIESAQALQRLHDLGLSDADIARRLGKSRAWVANRRRLLQLPAEAQQAVASGELPERRARYLLQHLRACGYGSGASGDTVRELVQEYARTSMPERTLVWSLKDSQRIPWPPETPSGWDENVTCGQCPHHVHSKDTNWRYCALDSEANAERARCRETLRGRFADSELRRVSGETGIPVIGEGERAARVTERTAAHFRQWIAEGAEHLRLMNAGGGRRPWWHPDLGSDFVTVGTVKPHLLDAPPQSHQPTWEQVDAWQREARRTLTMAIIDLVPSVLPTFPQPDAPIWAAIAKKVHSPLINFPSDIVEQLHARYGNPLPPVVTLALLMLGDAIRATYGQPRDRDAAARVRDGMAALKRIVEALGATWTEPEGAAP